MIELPGHTSIGCANCHSINHQTHDCPYWEDEDDVKALKQARAEDDGERITLDEYLEDEDV